MYSRTLACVLFGIFFIKNSSAQCIGNRGTLAYAPELPSSGGFAVRSTSPIAPTGVTVLSDQLVIEGPLIIDGQLPFLGTVALEGALPSTGAGNVAHSCGGAVGISEAVSASGIVSGAPITPVALGTAKVGPLGRGFGLPGRLI